MRQTQTNGFWSCHLYLLSTPDTERLCQTLSMKWAKLVLELGGTCDFTTGRLSLSTWNAASGERRKAPGALRAAIEMKAILERANIMLRRYGRKPIPYALLVDGVRPPVARG